jgi:hypothetical protein
MPQVHTNLVAAYLLPFWEALPFRSRLIGGMAMVVPGVRSFAARHAPESPPLSAGVGGASRMTNQG